MRSGLVIALGAAVFCMGAAGGPQQWPKIENEQRPGCYWWWMGSAVDEANITSSLQTYKEGGLGGVHIIPIYGAKGYEDRYVDYLSPRWMELLRHTLNEGKRLGLWVDMTTGTGWCFGGPDISEREANALVQHEVRKFKGGDTCDLAFPEDAVQAAVAYSADGRIEDLTDGVSRGRLTWKVPEGSWRLYVITQKFSGRSVKRAAPGGGGFMLNPFCGAALQTHLRRFDEAFYGYDGPMPRAQYHDSYEYVCDWSPDLFDEFARRRGYDLRRHLPALFSEEASDGVCRIKTDYRETVSDMLLENFTRPWVEWAHRYGCRTRDQAHGSPGNLLDLYAAADIPETEMFNKDRDPLIAKFASSAAHTTGKTKVAAETGTWLREHFNETLADVKELVDELFVGGVNHVIYHGNCYSPADAPWPGWLFYASTQMNPRNSFWRDVRALNDYIARCQSVLQAGESDNDILLYWPIHDCWHQPEGLARTMTVHQTDWFTKQQIGALARKLWNRGYAFDYISDRQLAECKFADGAIRTSGNRYKAIVVPAATHMPVETMRALKRLADSGARIVFDGAIPEDVPGMASLEERRAKLRDLAADPAGRFIVGGDLEANLAFAGVVRETLVDQGPAFIRRRHADGRYYFLTCKANAVTPVDGVVQFAAQPKQAAIMDPMTGTVTVIPVGEKDGALEVYLQMRPGQSLIIETFGEYPKGSEPWVCKKIGDPVRIQGNWQVKFVDGGPEIPQPFITADLGSWTKRGDAAADRFAGTARYSIAFDLPDAPADYWLLNLGRVAESARVSVNGKGIGVVFSPPWSVALPREILKDKGNALEIEVTNLAANRIRDLDRRKIEWRKFHDINLVNIEYKEFDASNWPIRDSGLIGPVTLQPVVNELRPR